MPPLSRWYVKTALIYLVLALLLGVLLAGGALARLPPVLALAGPAQIHLFVVGWLTQLIFGIAYWMFPKASAEHPRGNDLTAILTYVLLNAGLLARAVGEPWQAFHPGVLPGALLLASAAMQWAAGVGFAAATWPRVRGR